MTTSTRWATALLALAPASASPQAPLVDLDAVLRSGRVVASPAAGIGFTVPDGFSGTWDADAGAFIFQSSTQVMGGVWGWSEGGVDEVVEEVGRLLEEMGIELSLRTESSTTPNGVRGTFDAITEEGTGTLVATVQKGVAGNVVAIAAMGAIGVETELNRFVDDVTSSLQWATPAASQWRSQLEGRVMTWTSSDSNMSTGGGATATGASRSQATLTFCYGQYRYTESSVSYFSIEGLSASNNSSDEHSGAWAVVADLIGNPTLYLDSSDGRSFSWFLDETDIGFMIDGYLYRPDGSC